ncbi:hypothetical protein D0T12_11285 [Actinomadura spongiicola]|uniref:Uncharacterized protein n=1 Tax=Actinomadura spongiicola TaxID=2303421 RepID=A0A372GJS9_9ACTN|nr:hypothetical protein [Actinomadura spongiicola]RFS85595.1 hypothetical protein D0T12_11285 [Actinomadura spongiicola]
MTGDLGSDAGRARARPSFLPPVDGYPPPAGDTAPVAPQVTPPGRGVPWIAAMIVAASALLVSAFMPWARAQIIVELFGRPIGRDLGSVAGIDADDLVLAVPVLGVVAIALACGDLAGRDPRIGGLAAIPGTLALLVCGLFVLRLGDVRDDLPRTGLDVGYQITVRYGWYLAVIASLMVIGFSLARPISERVSKSRPRPDRFDPRYTEQQYYVDQQYYTDPRYYPATEQPPTDEPKQGQS